WQGSVTMTATVKNVGLDPAPPSGIVFYLSSDEVESSGTLCAADVPELESGATEDVSCTATLPESVIGTYSVVAWVDHKDEVFETDESNNIGLGASQLVIASPFNLVAVSLSFSASEVRGGESLDVTVDVANTGLGSMGAFGFTLYASTDGTVTTEDTPLCESGGAIGPQTSTQITFSCFVAEDFAPGTYWVGVVLDPWGYVPEA